MKTQAILSILLALALAAPTATASIQFVAILNPVGGPSVPGSGNVSIIAENSTATWQVNVTGVVGLSQLQVVDGADGSVEGVTLKTLTPPINGDANLEGSFTSADLNPAVASDVMELQGHICMGHIYAAAKMESGAMLMGKLMYVPEQGSTLTCEEAVPGTHGSTTDDHTSGAAVVSSAFGIRAASKQIAVAVTLAAVVSIL